jgi:type I restriction enzyme S subunit
MEVRPGYKQTVVGPIPAQWDVRRIAEFATVGSGGTPSRAVPAYWNGSIPWITTAQIQFGVIDTADQYITPEGLESSAAKLLPTGTLLMAMYGQGKTRGKVGILGIPATTNQACASICLRDGVSREFVLYYLTSKYEDIRSSSNSGSQDNLSGYIVKQIPIALPTLEEQRAIAEALTDVDALLAGLDRLIAKKRDIKQAAMQQLLTGQTRLPGFQGEWEVKRLGDLGVFLKGSGVKKDESRSGDLPCVRYGEIYTHHNDCIRSFNSWISREVARTATRLKSGDLLFAGSGETKAEIGKCVAFVQECEAYAGGDIVILRPAGVDPVFLGYYCNTSPINAQKASMGQGDAVVHISAAALAAVAVGLPTQAEQSAIATVLSDMDAELTALEARRDKTRSLKQGMMQELLTGRTRLV